MSKNLHTYAELEHKYSSDDLPSMLCCFCPISACGGAGPVAEEGGGAAQAGGGQHQPYRLENSEGHGPALPSQEVPLHTRYVTYLNGTYRYTQRHSA